MTRLRVVAVGAIAGAVSAIVACTSYDSSDPPPDDGGTDATTSDALDAGGDTTDAIACEASTHDFGGCACAVPGAVRDCFHGVPGPKSTCNTAGSQQCAGGLWTACEGGTLPQTEVCFDDIDNDCDGVVDDGCICSPDVDLCRVDHDAGATAYDPDAYTIFTIPAVPKANQKFDLFIVTQSKPLVDPGLEKNPGAQCFGGGLGKACPSAGAGCPGWKVRLFHDVVLPTPATYSFAIHDPAGATGCEGPVIATLSVVVTP